MDIETEEEPLTIEDIYAIKTGYPLKMLATFHCDDPSLKKIWNIGWRTAALCAGELYYDSPYYEQLQYTGDTRVQALISLYTSGEDALMKKAINDFYHSRTPEELSPAHYSNNRLQIIPTFSLFWISMIHDYWMHRKNDIFIRQFLPAIAEIMGWYEHQITGNTKMLGNMSWWNFTDWDNFNGWGIVPGAETGNSAIISLQYAYTLKQSAELFKAFKRVSDGQRYADLAEIINKNTVKLCLDSDKTLLADTPEKISYSQHANIWAILSGAVSGDQAKYIMTHVLYDKSIEQATFFYRFYLNKALKKAGMASQYYHLLRPWQDMVQLGLNTFAQKPEPPRSDYHVWSASPSYDFLTTICGIESAGPGFDKVSIQPNLGPLTEVSGSMPHPLGIISVHFERTTSTGGLSAVIKLPVGINGDFFWGGQKITLHGGKQELHLSS